MEIEKKRGRPRADSQTTAPAQVVGSVPVEQLKTQGRKFSTQKEFVHDLYKLEVAKFKKNIAIDGHSPDYADTEHVHYFHTITSDGKPQVRTNSVGGHYHKVEIIPQADGLPPIVKCASGPMKEVIRITQGKRVRTEIPFNDVDYHTHDVSYVKSNVIVERIKNVEAAKAEAELSRRAQSASVTYPGIESGD